ncbi:MAG: electron transfer flavoprotein subunit alpha/FixB family protein [Candidatus Binatia bacterium]
MSVDILVCLEHDGQTLHGEMPRLISKASELAQNLGGRAIAALVGDIDGRLQEEAERLDCQEIVLVTDPALMEYHPELYCSAFESVIVAVVPQVVFFRHSYTGVELASALAHRFNGATIANVLDVEVKDGRISVLRAYFRELCWGRVSPRGAAPCFLTVQKFSLRHDPPVAVMPAPVRRLTFSPPASLRIRSRGIKRRAETVDISKAEKIVSVGRGIKNKANIKIVEELADALGASMGCSRPIVDLGWLPVERQVGLSGKTVRPKVYLACGISGESQHIAGMKDAALIIAINADPAAPIFRVAHYGVVADLFKFLPVLTAAARRDSAGKGE